MKHCKFGRQLSLCLLILVCLLLSSAASANGAMSLALATFVWPMWLAYVIVTIIFEAAILGRWLGMPFGRALTTSLGANFLTAVVGGLFSGIAYVLLGLYGRLNPNPFGQTLLAFTVFGILSAIVETHLWMGAAKTKNDADQNGSAVVRFRKVRTRCLVVHLLGVPLGMAVLLIPPRPYPGLAGQVYAARFNLMRGEVRKALEVYIGEHHAVPAVHSYAELLQLLRPRLGRFANDRDLWAAAYVPDYRRFDTTESRRIPIEWNSRASGYKVPENDENKLWLIRSEDRGFRQGLVLDGGLVRIRTDRKLLGYADNSRSESVRQCVALKPAFIAPSSILDTRSLFADHFAVVMLLSGRTASNE